MRSLQLTLVAVIAATALSAGAAQAACSTDNASYQDTFDSLNPTWGKGDNEVSVDGGQLVIKPKANFTRWLPSNAGIYDDVDICTDATTVSAGDPKDSYFGLVFWYVDNKNFYTFQVGPDGSASVWRKQRGRWLSQIGWTKTDLIKQGDGASNEVRVTTKGADASYFINGQLFKEAQGVPPDNGQQVGVIAASPKKAVATYSFDDFVVVEPAATN